MPPASPTPHAATHHGRRSRTLPYAPPAWPLAAVTVALAATLWLAYTAGTGFAYSHDSMSYAALAQGFTDGHWFTSDILPWGSVTQGFRGEWPPLYPVLVGFGNAIGLTLPWSEYVLSGVAFVAAAALGALTVQTVCGRVPWTLVALLAGFPFGLYVAGYGWSEPLCLALLGLHYWLAARATAAARAGRRVSDGLYFAQGLVAGLAFLDRYAAVAFLPGALLLPLLLRPPAATPSTGSRRARRPPPAPGWVAACCGLALPAAPWSLACLILTGRIGAHYLVPGAGLVGALVMLRHGAAQATRWWLTGAGGPSAAPAGLTLAWACAACAVLGAVLSFGRRSRHRRPGARFGAAGAMVALLVADAFLSTALLVAVRAHYAFDPLNPRLLTPSLYAGMLAAALLLAALPGRPLRALPVAPLALLVLWHGYLWGRAAVTHPRLAQALSGPWCTPADCPMLAWLQGHTTAADLIVGDAAFVINFQLGRTALDAEPYPYDPNPTAPELRHLATQWVAQHPGAHVWLVMDASRGAVAASGPVMMDFWSDTGAAPAGIPARLDASGKAYRVWLLLLPPATWRSPPMAG